MFQSRFLAAHQAQRWAPINPNHYRVLEFRWTQTFMLNHADPGEPRRKKIVTQNQRAVWLFITSVPLVFLYLCLGRSEADTRQFNTWSNWNLKKIKYAYFSFEVKFSFNCFILKVSWQIWYFLVVIPASSTCIYTHKNTLQIRPLLFLVMSFFLPLCNEDKTKKKVLSLET